MFSNNQLKETSLDRTTDNSNKCWQFCRFRIIKILLYIEINFATIDLLGVAYNYRLDRLYKRNNS